MILNEAPDLGGNFSAIPAHNQDLPNGTTGQPVTITMSSEWMDGVLRDSEPKSGETAP